MPSILRRVGAWLRRERLARELDEELETHRLLLADRLRRMGWKVERRTGRAGAPWATPRSPAKRRAPDGRGSGRGAIEPAGGAGAGRFALNRGPTP
jgi:hypothetical protein